MRIEPLNHGAFVRLFDVSETAQAQEHKSIVIIPPFCVFHLFATHFSAILSHRPTKTYFKPFLGLPRRGPTPCAMI